MSFSQAQIDALEAAIGSGVLTVEYQGKRTTYRSLAEMRSILSQMKAEVALANGGTPRMRFVRFIGDKAL